jgi:hypothetical protein
MSDVTIEKPETASERGILTDESNTIMGRIRERAFELFEKSGEQPGDESGLLKVTAVKLAGPKNHQTMQLWTNPQASL